MKRFALKFTLFLLPLILTLGIELFVLPIDFFTFRVWEALAVRIFLILPGPFYPDQEITKMEEGDLAHHTPYAFKQKAKWVTDRYGYRKENRNFPRHEVVIIGDSNVAGCSLTQEKNLSEVLEERLGVSTYPLAPASIHVLLKDRRFIAFPPHIVILSSSERFIFDLPTLEKEKAGLKGFPSQLDRQIREIALTIKYQYIKGKSIQSLLVFLDRLYKNNMLHYLRANLRRFFSPRPGAVHPNLFPTKHGPIFFLQGREVKEDFPEDQFDKALRTIEAYHDLLKSKGIRFIFLPIPEKETIYYEALKIRKPIFLERFISKLKERGIETIETQKAYEEAFQKDVLLYQAGDTHWNENGVKTAAELIVKLIEKRK